MTVAALRVYDANIAVDHVVVTSDDATYCLDKTVDGQTAKVTRGSGMESGGDVVEGGASACSRAGAPYDRGDAELDRRAFLARSGRLVAPPRSRHGRSSATRRARSTRDSARSRATSAAP